MFGDCGLQSLQYTDWDAGSLCIQFGLWWMDWSYLFRERGADCPWECAILYWAFLYVFWRSSDSLDFRQIWSSWIHEVPSASDWIPSFLPLYEDSAHSTGFSHMGQLKSHSLWSGQWPLLCLFWTRPMVLSAFWLLLVVQLLCRPNIELLHMLSCQGGHLVKTLWMSKRVRC